jgi:hypothetical protein
MVPGQIATQARRDAPRDRERNGWECTVTIAAGREVG